MTVDSSGKMVGRRHCLAQISSIGFVILSSSRWLVALLLLALSVPVSGAAAPQLTLIHANGDAIERVVSESGTTPFIFHLQGADEAAFDIDLDVFLSEQGHQTVVSIGGPDAEVGSQFARLQFAKGEHRKELQLSTADMVPGVAYRGKLTASLAGQTPKQWTVTLRRPVAMAELVADVTRANLQMQLLSISSHSEFVITLREKSGAIPIHGITIRRAPGSEVHNKFDLKSHLRFFLDDSEIEDLTSWDPEKQTVERNIPAGEQRALRVEVRDLPRGDHKLVFQLDAVNAKPDSAPTVELNVQVRHAMWAPALVLLLAIMVSYLITKGIVNWRQRTKLRELTQTLGQEWLRDLRELPPVVWLQATRRQALVVLEQFSLLPAPGALTSRLEVGVRMLNVMRRYVDVRRKVEASISSYMLKFRFDLELDAVIGSIDPHQLNETNEAALIAELDSIEQAIADPVLRYRPYVVTAQKLTNGMDVLSKLPVSNATEMEKLDKLWRDYVAKQVAPNSSEGQLVLADRVCASMRVLKRHLDLGDDDVLKDLAPLIAQDNPTNIDIVRVFRVTNDAMWAKIKKAVESGGVKISPSEQLPSATPRKALVPMTFSVEIGDATLNDSFMAKKRMLADWKFELQPSGKKKKKPIPWATCTSGKRLLQFVPAGGTLKTRVSLRHLDNRCQELKGSIDVERAYVSLTSRLFAVQEFVLILVAVVIAFASGMVMYYDANHSFGSMQDYLALFTWGVGVDQGKNLAQTFTGLSAQSKGGDAGE